MLHELRLTDELPILLTLHYAYLPRRYVKDADKDIIARIKEMGRLVDAGSINHRWVPEEATRPAQAGPWVPAGLRQRLSAAPVAEPGSLCAGCRSYPFCWRSDTPLIQLACPAWFVSVEPLKDKLLVNNKVGGEGSAVPSASEIGGWNCRVSQ